VLLILVAGLVAMALGMATRSFLGFSLEPGILWKLLGPNSFLLNPVAAAGTAGIFGVAYLGLTSLLGVGVPLRRNSSDR
jgi:hypothetical protein